MSRTMKGLAAAALAALSGCATVSEGRAPTSGGGEVSSISYQTGPCFGTCPIYRVTVKADGSGLFEGRQFTAVRGERAFAVTEPQFRAFAARLRPLRPAQGEVRYAGARCEREATDLPSVEVRWMASDGESQSLYYYYGCDMEKNRAMAERLQTAPDLLPIASFIRPPE